MSVNPKTFNHEVSTDLAALIPEEVRKSLVEDFK